MEIKRIQVAEGFLDGLDLRLSAGLNVLIGPRGTGKTSVIELIRFCLQARSFTDRAGGRALEQARAVLGSGQVSVTMDIGGHEFVVSRGADDDATSISSEIRATILSQNEIEWIGLDAVGRLRLIDSFRSDNELLRSRARALRSEARSLTVEGRSISHQIESLKDQIAGLTGAHQELLGVEEQQRTALTALDEAIPKQQELETLSKQAAQLSVKASLIERAGAGLSNWREVLGNAAGAQARLEPWPDAAGPTDEMVPIRQIVEEVHLQLSGVGEQLGRAQQFIEDLRRETAVQRAEVEARARALRVELEALKEGSGTLARRVAELREKAGQASALTSLCSQLSDRREEVLNGRDELLDQLDGVCEAEYEERAAVARRLNKELGPRINVKVERSGLPTAYVDALRSSLRGSGMRYNQLAPQIAERLSPRELTVAVERGDAQAIADIAEITIDRASRLISEIAISGAEEIVTCELQDTVTLSLLDGNEYKTTETLSTGQRCTVILPLLLSRRRDLLIIDQPEDHLDNGFIVDTAINAIRRRSQEGQLLVSTHNPNIPVLGDARTVVLMGSDGRRGFVRHAGALDDAESVEAITTVMEGGLDAFRRRSDFYEAQGSDA